MRTYIVESDFWERCLDTIKKVSNVHWLGIGASGSALVLMTLLLTTTSQSSQQQQHLQWTLGPYETNILPLPHILLAKRTLHLEGNINGTNIYWSQTCPLLIDIEDESVVKHVDVRHRGKQQLEFTLQKGSTVTLSVTNADGQIDVNVFSDWMDEQVYEKHQHTAAAPDAGSVVLYSGTADVYQDLHMEITADKLDTYVFLYQGKSGQVADATYQISRSMYDVESLDESDKVITTTKLCSYKDCTLPMQNSAGCLIMESTLTTHDLVLDFDMMINNHHFLIFMISFMPLLVALLYMKYCNAKPMVSSASTTRPQLLPGYELVTGDAEIF